MQTYPIKNNTIYRIAMAGMIVVSMLMPSCKKLIEVDQPKTKLSNEQIFGSDATVVAAALSMYIHMMENDSNFGSLTVETATGLSADEFTNYSTSDDQIALSTNSLTALNGLSGAFWNSGYTLIYQANSLIEGLANAPKISDATKKQILGEAKLVRAFTHFYLLNLYGDVPYVTSTDYKVNAVINRMPATEVYPKMIADLLDAENLLSDNYVTAERVRPNKWAAKALLARVYLYSGDWVKAEAEATAIINNKGSYDLENNLDNVFLNTSKEAIWQLIPVIANGFNAWESLTFVLTGAPTSVGLSQHVLSAFEPNDKRKVNWTSSLTSEGKTYYFPFKFKLPNGSSNPPTEYCMMFRVGEQYLIRAEARAQQNKLSDAIADLDMIRDRAGILLIKNTNPAIGKDALLQTILHERQVELFTEWGHRWLDLKRFNKASTVLAPIKGSNWQDTDVLYPIPDAQLVNNPQMKQNPGYK